MTASAKSTSRNVGICICFPRYLCSDGDVCLANSSITTFRLLPVVVQHKSALCERWG